MCDESILRNSSAWYDVDKIYKEPKEVQPTINLTQFKLQLQKGSTSTLWSLIHNGPNEVQDINLWLAYRGSSFNSNKVHNTYLWRAKEVQCKVESIVDPMDCNPWWTELSQSYNSLMGIKKFMTEFNPSWTYKSTTHNKPNENLPTMDMMKPKINFIELNSYLSWWSSTLEHGSEFI